MNFYIFHANDCIESTNKKFMWAIQYGDNGFNDERHFKMVKEVL